MFKDNDVNDELLSRWISKIKELRKQGYKIGVVVGGGKAARQYIRAAKKLNANNGYLDLLGIASARQNARLLISTLDNVYPEPPRNFEELIKALSTHELVICGGFQPGQSTNAVASIFAELTRANFLFNITKVDKVYDADPSFNKSVKSYDKLSYDEFYKIISRNSQTPGAYALFDHLGLEIVKRSKIKLVFLDGEKPELVTDVLNGKDRGTIVEED